MPFVNDQQNHKVEIGVLGGSGFYDLLEKAEEVEVITDYGKPSDKITIGEYVGRRIAFLPRHSKNHTLPPHQIPYRANLAAFKKLNVQRIIAPCAAGSLQPHIKPGDFVILNQFVDRTKNRPDTFYDGPPAKVAHISAAHPYCPQLSQLAFEIATQLNIPVHPQGTVVVINGPRFSTYAESRWFTANGWEVVNMTQYPENILARELEICYTGIALITDYDVGLEGEAGIEPVNIETALAVFKENNEKVKRLIFEMIKAMPDKRECECGRALEKAIIG